MDIKDLEIDVKHNSSKDEYVFINGEPYTKEEVLEVSKKFLDFSVELLSCINGRDIKG